MHDDEPRYTVDDLAAQVGISVRTIRFYIAEGLLPGPDSRGRGPGYGEDHLLRLRLARRLVDRHLPLAEVRDRLAGLSLDDLRALLTEEDQQAQRRRGASPRAYVSELLEQARGARRAPAPPPPQLAAAARVAPLLKRAEPPPPSASWRRFDLVDGVELHVRTDVERQQSALIRRLLAAADAQPDAGKEIAP